MDLAPDRKVHAALGRCIRRNRHCSIRHAGRNLSSERDVSPRPHCICSNVSTTANFTTSWITQTYYGSIGYATPSALGADVALTEHAEDGTRPRGRTLLLTGDGSLQLTIQEVGTMIHYGLAPVIFLINNAGYTIERVIHGARQPYNDIVPYNFSHTLQLFGMPEDEAKANFHRVATKAEFEEVVAKESVRHPNKVQLIEVVMDALDAPWRLVNQVATRGEESIKKMKEAGFKIREHQKVLPLVNGSDGDAKPTVGMQGAVDGNPEKQQKA